MTRLFTGLVLGFLLGVTLVFACEARGAGADGAEMKRAAHFVSGPGGIPQLAGAITVRLRLGAGYIAVSGAASSACGDTVPHKAHEARSEVKHAPCSA